MNEFLLEYKNLITTALEILAAITGIFCFNKYKGTVAKYFIFFLIYLTVCDFLGGYNKYIHNGKFLSFLKETLIENNYWWFTSFWKIGAILFFSFYYYKILKNQKFKNVVKYCGFIFLSFSFIYIILNWNEFFTSYFPIISILGAIIIFLCTVFYFIETLISDRILTFYKSLNFYISSAIFVWWLIVTPIVFYDIYMTNMDWDFIFLRWQIYLFANVFMYATLTFALIYCEPVNDEI